LEELKKALRFFGIATPISNEELSLQKERYYRKLAKSVIKYQVLINNN